MPYPDLQSFIADLEQRHWLTRVGVEVDPVLEIAAVADRQSKLPAADGNPPPPTDPQHGDRGGHALLFEHVTGSAMPVAINLFGSYARMQLALGVGSLDEVADRIRSLIRPDVPTSLWDKMKKLPELAKLAGFGPKRVKRALCQEVVKTDDASLLDLPIIQCWPHDGEAGYGLKPAGEQAGTGRYITLAAALAQPPGGGAVNLGMYRVQVFGPKLAAIHWHMHHDGARLFRKYRERGERMPIALVFGGEPVLPYAATCPLPPEVSELIFAGFLQGSGIEVAPAKTVPLEVPARAEIVIEGYVDPQRTLIEGPFGDHTGFYSLADHYPELTVTAITHRRNAVYPTTVVGPPPQEDYYLGKATERIFLPLLQMLVPDLLDYSLPMFGAFHNCVFVRIRKEYPMQARRVMSSLWGAGQMAFTKMIVVVDEQVDVHDEQSVLFQLAANVDWRRDIMVIDGPTDILDHATPYYGTGAKIGIDATRKIPGEGVVRDWPAPLQWPAELLAKINERWSAYGFEPRPAGGSRPGGTL